MMPMINMSHLQTPPSAFPALPPAYSAPIQQRNGLDLDRELPSWRQTLPRMFRPAPLVVGRAPYPETLRGIDTPCWIMANKALDRLDSFKMEQVALSFEIYRLSSTPLPVDSAKVDIHALLNRLQKLELELIPLYYEAASRTAKAAIGLGATFDPIEDAEEADIAIVLRRIDRARLSNGVVLAGAARREDSEPIVSNDEDGEYALPSYLAAVAKTRFEWQERRRQDRARLEVGPVVSASASMWQGFRRVDRSQANLQAFRTYIDEL